MKIKILEETAEQLHLYGRVRACCRFCLNYVIVDDLVGSQVQCGMCEKVGTLWIHTGTNNGMFPRQIGPL